MSDIDGSMMSAGSLLRWHWSALTQQRPSGGESDSAGLVSARSSKEALDAAAREIGCDTQPQHFRHWRSGAMAVYTNSHGDIVTVLVVVSRYIAVKWYCAAATASASCAAVESWKFISAGRPSPRGIGKIFRGIFSVSRLLFSDPRLQECEHARMITKRYGKTCLRFLRLRDRAPVNHHRVPRSRGPC